jgi:hypothetical protein
MANQKHLERIMQGTDVWNSWREQHPEIQPDLFGAYLAEANLSRADLRGTNLGGAFLSDTNLSRANLSRANLFRAYLYKATLSGANLSEAILQGAYLYQANFSGADLSGANLSGATLVDTNLTNTILKDCNVYGISVWDAQLDGAEQLNLTITPDDQPTITVDNLKIAQFIYLLLNNEEIRDVINTITTKVILILGRFTHERKTILDAIRGELRKHNYIPVLFDFDQPSSRDVTETVTTLARLARFIIADLTDAKSIPQELAFIVPDLPSVPVQPLLLSSQREYGMFEHFKKFPWVLPIHRYTNLSDLLACLKEQIIEPAEQKAKELEKH